VTTGVLAICSGGGVGDLLAATPAMRSLARHFDRRISVMASPYAAPVLQDQPWLEEMLLDDGSESSNALAGRLREGSFGHAIVFWSTARIADAVRRAGIAVRAGQARRLYSWKYTNRVLVKSETGDTTTHWTSVQMEYARAIGASPQLADYVIDVRLRPENAAEAARVLAAANVPERFAVLHAARGIPLDRVRWPIDRFAAIGDAIATSFAVPIVLTGATADAASIDAIGAAMRAPHAAIAGKTSLMGLAALLGKAALVVALDSGPMHIAAALGVPTVGVFALRTDRPDRWRPLGPSVAVVRPSYPCPLWHTKENCKTFDCYAHLEPQTVVEAARSIVGMTAPDLPAPQTSQT
jgi:ADP-heptose:LPS heptosyltransferase